MYQLENPQDVSRDNYALAVQIVTAILPAYSAANPSKAAAVLNELSLMGWANKNPFGRMGGDYTISDNMVAYLNYHFYNAPKPEWYRAYVP